MMKIEELRLSLLRNSEHTQFMIDMNTVIHKFSANDLGIEEEYAKFKQLVEEQDLVMRATLRSAKSKELEKKDTRRDRTWKAISTHLKNLADSPIEAEVLAAEPLLEIVNKYGDIRKLNYSAETTDMRNLCIDLLDPKNAELLATTRLTAWVTALQDTNNQFSELFVERYDEKSNRGATNVKPIRIQLDAAYNDMVEKIHALIRLKMAHATMPDLVNKANEVVKHFQDVLAIRKGRKNQDDEADDTNDTKE